MLCSAQKAFPLKILPSALDLVYALSVFHDRNTTRMAGVMAFACLPEKWLLFLFPWHQSDLIAQAGGEVARQCQSDIWRRVGRLVVGMSVAEIRGYVRAVAAEHAAAEVEQALDRHKIPGCYRDKILASSVEQIIHRTICDVLNEMPPCDAKIAA